VPIALPVGSHHGTAYAYVDRRCGCASCRTWNRARSARGRAARWADRVLVDGAWYAPRAAHGTTTGYTMYGCRCAPCTAANTTVGRRRRRDPADEEAP
jgi:hypothetical protein